MKYAGLGNDATGEIKGVVAPVKGLNTRTALAGLSIEYAIQLDNFICQPDAIITRLGAADHVTGFTQPPKTLMSYSSATVNKMFAASSNALCEVTTAGVVGASLISNIGGPGKFVNFATSAGQFLLFANGINFLRSYNGTTWSDLSGVSSPAITGPSTGTFIDVEAYRARLYFLQKDFLGFYYLPADSIGGAATAFRIGSVCRLGGYAIAHGTWSIDGGSGPDDHYVIATSNGEIIVYKGSDPSSVTTWTYFGTFFVGKPLGPNSFQKFGGDLLYLCENGLIPLSTLLQSTTRNYSAGLSFNIQPSIAKAVAMVRNSIGWTVKVVPSLSLVIINVPSQGEGLKATQFVYNSFSKAWSTFSNWDAADFIEFDNKIFFTTGTKVAQAFKGFNDFGANITAICDTGYNRFGTRSQQQPVLVRALFASTNIVSYTIGLAQDFSGNYLENFYSASGGSAGIWNTGLWNIAFWSGEFNLRKDWVTVASRSGLALSTRFKVESNAASTLLLALDYKFATQGLVS